MQEVIAAFSNGFTKKECRQAENYKGKESVKCRHYKEVDDNKWYRKADGLIAEQNNEKIVEDGGKKGEKEGHEGEC